MLRYTGHPLADIGVATLTAFAGKRDPSDVTETDLEMAADYMTCEYTRQPLKSFLTVAFPNSGFTQPAFETVPERRLDYARRVLRGYRADTSFSGEVCVFTGEPAVAVAFGDKPDLPLGRAFRQHIPLTTGEDVINFHPNGDAGLPISGMVLLAIQAFPLGCAKVAGRLLAVHSDNDEILLHFAESFLSHNRRLVQLAQEAGSHKMDESQLVQKTLLVDTLLNADSMHREARAEDRPFSLTAYYLTNLGQNAALDIYYLPLQITGFLREMQRAEYCADWSTIIRRGWEIPPSPKKGAKQTTDSRPRKNNLFEDLFDLPDNAPKFLRKHLLRPILGYLNAEQENTHGGNAPQTETAPAYWKITARFLKRIMNMEKDRIEAIRTMGDRLADYVTNENDRRFFRDFFTERRYDYLRTTLIKANIAQVRRGRPPIITLDPYIVVFEEGDEVARSDWQLARDLVLIRLIERLYEQGWLGSNADVIPVESEEQTVSVP